MVQAYFVPDIIIARGIYNEHYAELRMFKDGEGWDDLPAVYEDSLKFYQGFMEIGVEETDFTLSYDFGFDDFQNFFRETVNEVRKNF